MTCVWIGYDTMEVDSGSLSLKSILKFLNGQTIVGCQLFPRQGPRLKVKSKWVREPG